MQTTYDKNHGFFGSEATKESKIFDKGIEQDRLTLRSVDVARLLGMSRSTFYRGVANGQIDLPYLTLCGERRYLPETVINWLKEKQIRPNTPKQKRKYEKWQ